MTAFWGVLFCFWPNFLFGFFIFLTILGWLCHDAHGFLRAVWRIILSLILLIGIWWTAIWLKGASMDHLSSPAAITIGVVTIAGAVFFLVRSILNARKDWTMVN